MQHNGLSQVRLTSLASNWSLNGKSNSKAPGKYIESTAHPLAS